MGSYTQIWSKMQILEGYAEWAIFEFPGPLYQSEIRCSTFDMEMSFHSHTNKTHFHKKGRAPNLVLIQRPGETRKWPS